MHSNKCTDEKLHAGMKAVKRLFLFVWKWRREYYASYEREAQLSNYTTDKMFFLKPTNEGFQIQ